MPRQRSKTTGVKKDSVSKKASTRAANVLKKALSTNRAVHRGTIGSKILSDRKVAKVVSRATSRHKRAANKLKQSLAKPTATGGRGKHRKRATTKTASNARSTNRKRVYKGKK